MFTDATSTKIALTDHAGHSFAFEIQRNQINQAELIATALLPLPNAQVRVDNKTVVGKFATIKSPN